MNIYVYSDESGVFDVKHNTYYVYGGLIFLEKDSKNNCLRRYLSIERMLRKNGGYDPNVEMKATRITNIEKYKLWKSLNKYIRFGVVISQPNLHSRIFTDKKTKQRYLDYAYKMGLKNALLELIKQKRITPNAVENLYVFADEHTTATNGRYELQEGLEKEFKLGTFNVDYRVFYDPIFDNLKSVTVTLCDSSSKPLIRAADIVANNIYYKITKNIGISGIKDLYVKFLP